MARDEFEKSKFLNREKLTPEELSKIAYVPITQQKFLEGLNLILNNCYFTYNNVTYKQIFGSPMGSPVSPILADLVMEFLEQNVLDKLPIKPLIYYRYVDDIIMIIDETQISSTLNAFNSFNKSLKFTIEIENNNRLPFLDVCLIRTTSNELITDWYHKDIWSGRYLNYLSNLPQNYKRNTVSIMVYKIIKLSHHSFHNQNYDLLYDTLLKNNYPDKFLRKEINKAINKYTITNTIPTNELVPAEGSKTRIGIPYVKGVFEKIKWILKKHDIVPVAKPVNSLNQFYGSLKDKTPDELKSNLIYKVDCNDCNLEYIGETSQYLKKRLYQHKYHIRKSNTSHSALAEHAISNNHNINWNGFKILGHESNTFKRKLIETIHIKKSKMSMNLNTDSERLDNVYSSLFLR